MIKKIALISWFVIMIFVNLGLAFTHPDMTSTRLFLTYWPIYTVEAILNIGLIAYLQVKN